MIENLELYQQNSSTDLIVQEFKNIQTQDIINSNNTGQSNCGCGSTLKPLDPLKSFDATEFDFVNSATYLVEDDSIVNTKTVGEISSLVEYEDALTGSSATVNLDAVDFKYNNDLITNQQIIDNDLTESPGSLGEDLITNYHHFK